MSSVETVGFDYGQRHRIELAQRGSCAQTLWPRSSRNGPSGWARTMCSTSPLSVRFRDTALTSDKAIEMGADNCPTLLCPAAT